MARRRIGMAVGMVLGVLVLASPGTGFSSPVLRTSEVTSGRGASRKIAEELFCMLRRGARTISPTLDLMPQPNDFDPPAQESDPCPSS